MVQDLFSSMGKREDETNLNFVISFFQQFIQTTAWGTITGASIHDFEYLRHTFEEIDFVSC